jgi:hypothetical protein
MVLDKKLFLKYSMKFWPILVLTCILFIKKNVNGIICITTCIGLFLHCTLSAIEGFFSVGSGKTLFCWKWDGIRSQVAI